MIQSEQLRKNLWIGYFALLAIGAIAVYVQLGVLLCRGALFAFYSGKSPGIADFVVLYSGAVLAFQQTQNQICIYDSPALTDIVRIFTTPMVPTEPFFLQYPPYFFAIIKPIAFLSLMNAWFVWCIASLVFIAFSLHLILSKHVHSVKERALIIVGLFASYPCWVCFRFGQTSFWLLLGATVFWSLLSTRKYFWTGVATGLALIKVQYAPFLVVAGFAYGRGEYLKGLAIALFGLFVWSILGVGWENTASYANVLTNGELTNIVNGVEPFMMQNVRGQLNLLLGDDTTLVKIVSLTAFVVVLAVVAYVWDKLRTAVEAGRVSIHAFDLVASFTTLAMLVFGLHTHIQDYVVALLPCVWLWPTASRVERWLIVLFPLISWLIYATMIVWLVIKIEPYLLWAVMLTVLSFRANKQLLVSLKNAKEQK